MISPSSRVGRAIAITGAGSGVGRDIALGFSAKGYIVFGTAMSAAEVQDLRHASHGRVSLTVCNIAKLDAVQALAGGVSDALGNAGIDILINNAALFTPGPLEVLPLDVIRNAFEVNVFGALSVINAFLPALRKARGRIVMMSTWTADLPLVFNGTSAASNAAMEVMSAVYRDELQRFGIDVVVAHASTLIITAAALKQVPDEMTPEQRKLYGKMSGASAVKLHSLQEPGIEQAMVAARVIELAERHPGAMASAIGPVYDEMLRTVREKCDAA